MKDAEQEVRKTCFFGVRVTVVGDTFKTNMWQ